MALLISFEILLTPSFININVISNIQATGVYVSGSGAYYILAPNHIYTSIYCIWRQTSYILDIQLQINIFRYSPYVQLQLFAHIYIYLYMYLLATAGEMARPNWLTFLGQLMHTLGVTQAKFFIFLFFKIRIFLPRATSGTSARITYICIHYTVYTLYIQLQIDIHRYKIHTYT